MQTPTPVVEHQRQGTELPFVTIERATGVVVGSTRFGNIEYAIAYDFHINALHGATRPVMLSVRL